MTKVLTVEFVRVFIAKLFETKSGVDHLRSHTFCFRPRAEIDTLYRPYFAFLYLLKALQQSVGEFSDSQSKTFVSLSVLGASKFGEIFCWRLKLSREVLRAD